MSHELRTPLNAILGYSEMLHEEAVDKHLDEFSGDLEKINAAGKHLLALINDILDLSKIEAGKMELFLENFDVAKMIDEVASTIRPLVEKNANTLHIGCAGFGRDARRPDQGAPGSVQSPVQRCQVHPRRPRHAGRQPPAHGWQRVDRVSHVGHRHRHEPRTNPEALSGLHPGRCLDHAQVRRHRPGAGPHAPLLSDDGRRRDRAQRAGRGQRLHHHAARRRRRSEVRSPR